MEPEGSIPCSQEPSTGPSGLPTNILYAFLFFTIRATFPAHRILLNLIILIILGEEYKLVIKIQEASDLDKFLV
jgi:hypothetical protein